MEEEYDFDSKDQGTVYQQKINFSYKIKLLRGIGEISKEVFVFLILLSGLYKNSIISPIYFYFAVRIVTAKEDRRLIAQIITILSISMII